MEQKSTKSAVLERNVTEFALLERKSINLLFWNKNLPNLLHWNNKPPNLLQIDKTSVYTKLVFFGLLISVLSHVKIFIGWKLNIFLDLPLTCMFCKKKGINWKAPLLLLNLHACYIIMLMQLNLKIRYFLRLEKKDQLFVGNHIQLDIRVFDNTNCCYCGKIFFYLFYAL